MHVKSVFVFDPTNSIKISCINLASPAQLNFILFSRVFEIDDLMLCEDKLLGNSTYNLGSELDLHGLVDVFLLNPFMFYLLSLIKLNPLLKNVSERFEFIHCI